VGVRSVLDGDDLDAVVGVVDAVDGAVVAAPGAVQAGQPELQGLADPVRVGRERAVGELDVVEPVGVLRPEPPGRSRRSRQAFGRPGGPDRAGSVAGRRCAPPESDRPGLAGFV
jgi:hypothetical protein